MPAPTRRAFCAMAIAFPVAGCLRASPPPPPELAPIDYATRRDGGHTIPAVPIDQVPEDFRRQVVPLESELPPGTMIVNTETRHLYLLLDGPYAIRYGIGVGREGFGWRGPSEVFARKSWPTWTPPPEMIRRQPELARWAEGQPGGPRNPLGARAIYLAVDGRDTGYRIHGTPEWQSIGQAASSGCFRMINHDVIDLFDRVRAGSTVIVI